MTRLQNIAIYLIGIIFLLSGLGKAINVLYFQSLIHLYGFPYLDLLAPVIIWVELVLAFLYLVRWRVKTISLCSIVLLLLFTMVYTFGYTRRGITDCGCFGVLSIPELPTAAVYIRNLILLVLSNYLYFTASDAAPAWSRRRWIIFSLFLSCSVFCTGMSFRPGAYWPGSPHPLEGKAVAGQSWAAFVPQSESVLVLFYSYQCSHCMNTVENVLALERYALVDTVVTIAVTNGMETDSLSWVFWQHYGRFGEHGIEKETLPDIKEFPTSLLIENDTIRQVFIGELPNPYLIETTKNKFQ